jgi:Cu(I)/Ag(I) efflux system membrane fusion protein
MLGEAVAVPETAVLHTGEREFVFVKSEKGSYEPVPVRTGRKADGYYEVLEGLSGGETVVVNGTFFLDSESRLQATFLKSDTGGAEGHVHG